MGEMGNLGKQPPFLKGLPDPEEERRLAMARMGLWRRELIDRGFTKDEVDKLDEVDYHLYARWEKGELPLEIIQNERNILINLRPKTEASLKLLDYMERQLKAS